MRDQKWGRQGQTTSIARERKRQGPDLELKSKPQSHFSSKHTMIIDPFIWTKQDPTFEKKKKSTRRYH